MCHECRKGHWRILGGNFVMPSIYEVKLQQIADSLLQTIHPLLNPDSWDHEAKMWLD